MMNYIFILVVLLLGGCGGRQTNPKQQIKETDSRITVHFKYTQLVDGYEITGRLMPFDSHSETGKVIIYFRHVESGQSFQYTENIYRNFDMDEITFSEGFKGYQDGDIYYLNYGAYNNPDSYNDSPLYYYAPFQFYDVDFDGE